MSVICYDGEILAGDRKARITGLDGSKRVTSLSKEKIRADFNGVFFDGEEVRAVGRAGLLKVSTEMIDILRRSKDLSRTIDQLGDKLFKKFDEEGPIKAASLLIMTTHHVHIVKVNKNYEVKWQKEHRSKKLAIGSGQTIALFLMEYQGLSATAAVAAMELNHDCCGGGVTYTTRSQALQNNPVVIIEGQERGKLLKTFLKNTIDAAKQRLVSVPTM